MRLQHRLDKTPHENLFCYRLTAAKAALAATGFALAAGGGTSASAQTLQNGPLRGNWLTTGKTVAAITFTQTSQAVSNTADLVSPDDGPYFARLSPTGQNGETVGEIRYSPGETDAVTSESAPLFGYRPFNGGRGDGGFFGGSVPAPVPEPGIMVTVVALGFSTGVALLRGKTRVAAAHHLPAHRLW